MDWVEVYEVYRIWDYFLQNFRITLEVARCSLSRILVDSIYRSNFPLYKVLNLIRLFWDGASSVDWLAQMRTQAVEPPSHHDADQRSAHPQVNLMG